MATINMDELKRIDPGPEIRMESDGSLYFMFDGADRPFYSNPETWDFNKLDFIKILGFSTDETDKAERAWGWWSSFLNSKTGQALRWFEFTAFLRDGINVNVRMG